MSKYLAGRYFLSTLSIEVIFFQWKKIQLKKKEEKNAYEAFRKRPVV